MIREAGELASRVLQAEDAPLKAFQAAIIQSFLDAASGMKEDDDAGNFEKGCELFSAVTKHVSSQAATCLQPRWLVEAQRTLARLDIALGEFGKSWAMRSWKQGNDPSELVAVFGNLKYLPQSLVPILHLGKNAQLLDGDGPQVLDMEGKDFTHVLKYVKKGLAVMSLDTQIIGDFFGEGHVQKVERYTAATLKVLEDTVIELEKPLKIINDILDKYRRPGIVFGVASVILIVLSCTVLCLMTTDQPGSLT